MTVHSLIATLTVAGIFTAVLGCQKGGESTATDGAQRNAASALDRVTAGPPTRKTLQLYTEQPGRVAAFEETPMFSKLAGYVAAVHFDIGDRVKAGQVLIKLSVPEYDDELEQKRGLLAQSEAEVKQSEAALEAIEAAANSAKSMVAQAEASIGRTEADYARWNSERQRMQQLVNTGSVTAKLADETMNQFRAAEAAKKEAVAGIESAKARMLEAQANIGKAKADVTAATARVRVAKASVTQAETMLAYTELRAPFDGVITRRNVDTGHYVHPANAPTSKPLLVVASTDRVRVFVDIPEKEASMVDAGYDVDQVGDMAVIRASSMTNQTFEGRVTRSSWSLDSENRSLTAEIDLPNEKNTLLPGSYVTVSILLEQRDNVLALPITAIIRDKQITYCCVVVSGKIERRPIQLGLRTGEEVEITSGLDGTETVVLARAASLQEGQKVEIIAKK